MDTTLRIVPTRVTDGPVAYSSRAYEWTVPGPTLMLKPGDTMRLLQVGGLVGRGRRGGVMSYVVVNRPPHRATDLTLYTKHIKRDTPPKKQVNRLGPETLQAAEVVPHTLHWPNTTTIHTHGLHMDPTGKVRAER